MLKNSNLPPGCWISFPREIPQKINGLERGIQATQPRQEQSILTNLISLLKMNHSPFALFATGVHTTIFFTPINQKKDLQEEVNEYVQKHHKSILKTGVALQATQGIVNTISS